MKRILLPPMAVGVPDALRCSTARTRRVGAGSSGNPPGVLGVRGTPSRCRSSTNRRTGRSTMPPLRLDPGPIALLEPQLGSDFGVHTPPKRGAGAQLATTTDAAAGARRWKYTGKRRPVVEDNGIPSFHVHVAPAGPIYGLVVVRLYLVHLGRTCGVENSFRLVPRRVRLEHERPKFPRGPSGVGAAEVVHRIAGVVRYAALNGGSRVHAVACRCASSRSRSGGDVAPAVGGTISLA